MVLREYKQKILKSMSSLLIVQESTTYYTISSEPSCEAGTNEIWENLCYIVASSASCIS